MSKLEKARRKMWEAWSRYCEAKREFERLERAACENFDRMLAGKRPPKNWIDKFTDDIL